MRGTAATLLSETPVELEYPAVAPKEEVEPKLMALFKTSSGADGLGRDREPVVECKHQESSADIRPVTSEAMNQTAATSTTDIGNQTHQDLLGMKAASSSTSNPTLKVEESTTSTTGLVNKNLLNVPKNVPDLLTGSPRPSSHDEIQEIHVSTKPIGEREGSFEKLFKAYVGDDKEIDENEGKMKEEDADFIALTSTPIKKTEEDFVAVTSIPVPPNATFTVEDAINEAKTEGEEQNKDDPNEEEEDSFESPVSTSNEEEKEEECSKEMPLLDIDADIKAKEDQPLCDVDEAPSNVAEAPSSKTDNNLTDEESEKHQEGSTIPKSFEAEPDSPNLEEKKVAVSEPPTKTEDLSTSELLSLELEEDFDNTQDISLTSEAKAMSGCDYVVDLTKE